MLCRWIVGLAVLMFAIVIVEQFAVRRQRRYYFIATHRPPNNIV